jgi:hypothetical protein
VATPDPGIRRVVIPQQTLSEISTSGEYFIRYRIVTEDETVTSEWSPKYKFTAAPIATILSTETISIEHKLQASVDELYMTLSWNIPTQLKDSSFDIFVKWGSGGTYEYVETTRAGSVNTLIPTSPSRPTQARFHIQLSSNPKELSTSEYIKLFETAATPTRLTMDGGTI